MKHLFLCALALVWAVPAAGQTIAGQTCASVTPLGDVSEGTPADIIIQPIATPGAYGQPMDCVLSRQPDGQVELLAVENVPWNGGQVQIAYRDTQLVARLHLPDAGDPLPIAVCFDDTPVAGEFECETFFHSEETGALFERTYSDLGDLVGLNMVVAPFVLFDGDVFRLELGRAQPSDIRTRLHLPLSDLTLNLDARPGNEPIFTITNVADILSLNSALDEPGARLIIEVSASRGAFYESFEVSPDTLTLRMEALSGLATLMLTGG